MAVTTHQDPIELTEGVVGFRFRLPITDEEGAVYPLTTTESVTLCLKFANNTVKRFDCILVEPLSAGIVHYFTQKADTLNLSGPFTAITWVREADGNEFASDEFSGTIKRALCSSTAS
jgi:hypothetical protein